METEPWHYNMKLKYIKCIHLTSNRRLSRIKFPDGSKVPRKVLTDTAEVNTQIAMAIKTARQLKPF